jgi:4-amino-4-deoxy-L-arabinose transferase-like glycosyltransferase
MQCCGEQLAGAQKRLHAHQSTTRAGPVQMTASDNGTARFQMRGESAKPALKIFLMALAIRWAYAILLFLSMGEDGLKGVDSIGYVIDANRFSDAILRGALSGWQWLSPQPHIMPLFGWALTLHVLAFGALGPLAFVLTQCVCDAATCIVVYATARALNERYATPAGIAAAINPTQIVISGYVFSDTIFVLFIALSLYAAVRWMSEPRWHRAALCGLAVGAAALTRPQAALWMPVLCVSLALYLVVARRLNRRNLAQLGGAAAIMALCLAPVLWRNVAQYGSFALTPQGGLHLARWVVPLVAEAHDATPWQQASEDMERRTRERFGPSPLNPFEASRQYSSVGLEELGKLGVIAAAKSWMIGAAINLGSPAIVLSPPVLTLPRTGYFATPGRSMLEKIENFLFRSESALYTWALLLGITGVVIVRLLQLVGFAALVRQRECWPALSLFVLWSVFVLATNGPIATPKYRLPIEPVLMVMAGAGLSGVSRWLHLKGRRA